MTVDDARPGPLRVWINDAVLTATQLDLVVPAPTSEQRSSAGATFSFDGSDTASFALTGDAVGMVRGRIGRSPDDAVRITTFLYP